MLTRGIYITCPLLRQGPAPTPQWFDEEGNPLPAINPGETPQDYLRRCEVVRGGETYFAILRELHGVDRLPIEALIAKVAELPFSHLMRRIYSLKHTDESPMGWFGRSGLTREEVMNALVETPERWDIPYRRCHNVLKNLGVQTLVEERAIIREPIPTPEQAQVQ